MQYQKCVRVCVRARARARVCVCVCVCISQKKIELWCGHCYYYLLLYVNLGDGVQMTVGKIYCVKLMVMKYRNKAGQTNVNEEVPKEVRRILLLS